MARYMPSIDRNASESGADDFAHFLEVVGRSPTGRRGPAGRCRSNRDAGSAARRGGNAPRRAPASRTMRTIFFEVGAAHQRIVDQDDALAFDRGAVRIVLHAHAEFAHALGRLNEGAADIVIADDGRVRTAPRNAGCSRRRRARRNPAPAPRRRPRHGFRARAAAPKAFRTSYTDPARRRWNPAARSRCIRRYTASGGFGGNGLWLCAPRSSNTTISPGSTSRTYFAPMMSSAQVSDAKIGQPSRSPSTSGADAERIAARRSASCWSATPANRRPRSPVAPR